ncbi:MAG: hypothetical protein FWF59_03125 [Turicibacter sp.]|nr:hypothetical protein [Turicibacter sp.]
MIIISDTTPIISLIKINQWNLLRKLFGTVLIPYAVFHELTTNPKFSDESFIVKNCCFIETFPVTNPLAVQQFREENGLDLGESEAIVLAKELKALSLLIDERKGRRVAHQEGLKITGTIGILKMAYEDNFLSKQQFTDCLHIIRESSLRISDKIIDDILNNP